MAMMTPGKSAHQIRVTIHSTLTLNMLTVKTHSWSHINKGGSVHEYGGGFKFCDPVAIGQDMLMYTCLCEQAVMCELVFIQVKQTDILYSMCEIVIE